MYLELLKDHIKQVNNISSISSNYSKSFGFEVLDASYKDKNFPNNTMFIIIIRNMITRKIIFRETFAINKDSKSTIDGTEVCAKKILESVFIYGLLGNNTFMEESKLFNTEL